MADEEKPRVIRGRDKKFTNVFNLIPAMFSVFIRRVV